MDLDADLVTLLNIQPISDHVYTLIELGANPETLNSNGYSLLHLLILNNQMDKAFEFIRQFRVNTNLKDKHGNPPLYYMLNGRYANKHILTMISLGASPLTRNKQGRAAIHLFLEDNDIFSVSKLLEVHPESARLRCTEGTPLEMMLNARHKRSFKADHYLMMVRYGSDPKTTDASGYSLLTILLNLNDKRKVDELVSLSRIPPADRLYYKPEYIDLFVSEEGITELISNLRNNEFKPNIINYLARFPQGKERLIAQIKKLAPEEQRDLFRECLQPGTSLHMFFSVSRGWFKTSNQRGTLLQIQQLLNTIEVDQNDKLLESDSTSHKRCCLF